MMLVLMGFLITLPQFLNSDKLADRLIPAWVSPRARIVVSKRWGRLLGSPKHRFQYFPDVFHDFFLGMSGGMYSICLEKFTFVTKTIQEERYEFDVVAFGELRVNILKLSGIGYAIIWRQLHSGQQYSGIVPLAGFNDGFEIIPDGFDGRSSQPIIASQLDNDDVRTMGLERFPDPVASSPCGFATDAVIDQICL